MRRLVIGALCMVLTGHASGQEAITVNKGSWETTLSMVPELTMFGVRQDIDPEFEFTTECWASEEDTRLDVDTIGIDNCDVLDSRGSDNHLSFDLSCKMDDIELVGDALIVVAPDRNSLQGSMIIEGEAESVSIRMIGLFSGHKTGACTG